MGVERKLAEMQIQQATSPWFQFFLKTDPADYLSKLEVPLLALNGELDTQVLSNSNIQGIKAALKHRKNNDYQVKIYPGLNHLFQPASTGLPSEYAKIKTTFSSVVIDDIVSWIESLL